MCEACHNEDDIPICEGCSCCQECCNCAETDCDCEVCIPRRACRYCGDTGWFYGDKEFGPCECGVKPHEDS